LSATEIHKRKQEEESKRGKSKKWWKVRKSQHIKKYGKEGRQKKSKKNIFATPVERRVLLKSQP
jgi:hypothetical protein